MKTSDVIAHFGSKAKIAKALNLTKGSISQWGETVPELRAFQIEKITNGKLKTNHSPSAANGQ
ncbi:Cro/CI family transcriptional regulator [Shewanella sp. SW32]|uniref:Cro/CI family transcriptional regulator n=1 Tax=Shewanella TaxID=22 RepID=UPI0021DA1B5D|nr:Cro/CI family transcriptional regulator [Shewanella sp. SW32]MCU7961179.1 Cro/CI family transcriptional regulator [Shewanella sp. SW32]